MASNADKHPRDGRRIQTREEFIKKVGPGSHIAERRKVGYYHHYLVAYVLDTGVQIIHYGTRYKAFARVHETFLRFDEIDFELGVYLIKSVGYPESEEEKEEAICRARSLLGEDNYSVAINNCEHFVTWALTERPVSYQIKDAKPSKKVVIDSFDACVSKETACKLAVDASNEPINKCLEKMQPVSKQPEIQACGQSKTTTSPAKTSVAITAENIEMVTRTTASTIMPFENVAMHISYSSKQFFPHIPVMLKLDPSLPLACLKTALPRTAAKYVNNSLPKLVPDIATKLGIDQNLVQIAQQAISEKAGEKSIQAAEKIALETAKKSAAAAGKEAISQAAKQAAKCAAITTTVIETIGVGLSIYKLNKARNEGTITDKGFQRGVCTKITGSIGSIAGSTLGAAIGQVLIPIPGVGALVGSALFGLAGKSLFSGVAGFLFDKIMK